MFFLFGSGRREKGHFLHSSFSKFRYLQPAARSDWLEPHFRGFTNSSIQNNAKNSVSSPFNEIKLEKSADKTRILLQNGGKIRWLYRFRCKHHFEPNSFHKTGEMLVYIINFGHRLKKIILWCFYLFIDTSNTAKNATVIQRTMRFPPSSSCSCFRSKGTLYNLVHLPFPIILNQKISFKPLLFARDWRKQWHVTGHWPCRFSFSFHFLLPFRLPLLTSCEMVSSLSLSLSLSPVIIIFG